MLVKCHATELHEKNKTVICESIWVRVNITYKTCGLSYLTQFIRWRRRTSKMVLPTECKWICERFSKVQNCSLLSVMIGGQMKDSRTYLPISYWFVIYLVRECCSMKDFTLEWFVPWFGLNWPSGSICHYSPCSEGIALQLNKLESPMPKSVLSH